MKLVVAAIGAARDPVYKALIEDYAERARRLAPSVGLAGPLVRDADAGRALSGQPRRAAEARLLARLSDGADVSVALDEGGRQVSSIEFANRIAGWRDDGRRQIAFLIGGADGHASDTLDRADLKLSLGALTWPHMLARAMLCEQLYRAMTILSGHPYHRE